MDPEAAQQNTTGLQPTHDPSASRRKSAFGGRKSSVAVKEVVPDIHDPSTLNDADRRLAEMGYTQVCYSPPYWLLVSLS